MFCFIFISCANSFISANHPEAIKKLKKGGYGILELSFTKNPKEVNFDGVYMIAINNNTGKSLTLFIKSATPVNAEKHIKTLDFNQKYYSNYVLPSGSYTVQQITGYSPYFNISIGTEFSFQIHQNKLNYLGEFDVRPIESEKGNAMMMGAKTIIDFDIMVSDEFSRDSAEIYKHFDYVRSLKLNKQVPNKILKTTEPIRVQTGSIPVVAGL